MATDDSNDSESEKSLVEAMEFMLKDKLAADIRIEVGPPDGETATFLAHKCVLMARSPVFNSMLTSVPDETAGEAMIRVTDIEPDIFKELLYYVYCDVVRASPEDALSLMHAAKKYMLPKLARACSDYVLGNLTVKNVLNILKTSLELENEKLISTCLKLICVNSEVMLSGAEILSASRPVIECILDANTLPVNELLVFETAIKWAKHQLQSEQPGQNLTDLQIRNVLGDLLYKIRFPVMKPVDFALLSSENGLLTAEEKEVVFYYLVTGSKRADLMFKTELRIANEVWIDRTVFCASKKFHSASYIDAVNFSTDKDVILTGIGVFSAFNKTGYDVDVEVLLAKNSLFKKRFIVPYTGKSDPFKLVLDSPIPVSSGEMYSVKAVARGNLGYLCLSCSAVCISESVTFRFSKHPESAYTDETRGQIPRLYFYTLQ